MAIATRDDLHRLLDALPESDLDAARNLLRQLLDKCEEDKRQAVIRALNDAGLLVSVPPPPTEETIRRFRERKLITVKGKPLSERIIEERR